MEGRGQSGDIIRFSLYSGVYATLALKYGYHVARPERPIRVNLDISDRGSVLPVWPHEQTSIEPCSISQTCHNRTLEPQQGTSLQSPHGREQVVWAARKVERLNGPEVDK